MNIIFPTNSESKRLEFRDCVKFGDESGYQANVLVRSLGFGLDAEFFFEQWSLEQFVANLAEMEASLRGEAILKPMWEDDHVRFEMLELGHLLVRGEFTRHNPQFQHLSFAFESDQSALSPFLADLRRLIQM